MTMNGQREWALRKLIVFVFSLNLSIVISGSDIVDTFARTDSNTVGDTEAVTSFRWFEVGDNINGEKTPVAFCLLYSDGDVLTPQGAYHDFWLSIVSGTRGVAIYSYHYRNLPELRGCWDMYCKAASEITGSEQLGRMILEGSVNSGVGFTHLSGPEYAPPEPFANPYGTFIPEMQYPSLSLLTKTWNGNTYIIAVNSSEESTPVQATITGLTGATTAKVLFEGRSIAVSGGSFTDSWNPLGVHIYRIE